MQTEKRAGRVMRNVAAVLVIILAIVALFQGFRMRGKEALFRNVAVETENLPEEKQSGDDRAKIACEQGKEVTYQGVPAMQHRCSKKATLFIWMPERPQKR